MTNRLIGKLETLVSQHDAADLRRQVFVSGRIKTMNETVYYSVDTIYNAISQNKKIKFQYYQWNVKKRTGASSRRSVLPYQPVGAAMGS